MSHCKVAFLSIMLASGTVSNASIVIIYIYSFTVAHTVGWQILERKCVFVERWDYLAADFPEDEKHANI